MKNLYTLFLGAVFLFLSCGDNVIEDPDSNLFGYDYFPVDVGYTWEYKVDSVLIVQGGNSNVVSTSYIEEKVTELISETGSEKTFKLERRYRSDLDFEWILQDVWQMSIDDETATKTEENLKFMKLVFPALKGKRWDGNVFFDSDKDFVVAANNITIYKDWNYKIEVTDGVKTINDQKYSSVLQVSHIDEESLISKRFSEEYYAQGIGLVERNMEIFDSQDGDVSMTWLKRAQEGFQIQQTLLKFSQN